MCWRLLGNIGKIFQFEKGVGDGGVDLSSSDSVGAYNDVDGVCE
jgi:hypothetical protein